MNLPECPNVRINQCSRSGLRLYDEDSDSWKFVCTTCHLLWQVSKPRTTARARYERDAERIAHATTAERADIRRRYFIPSGGCKS